MMTQNIPDGQWVEFFDQFSRDHAGWMARIEVLDKSAGPQRIADHLPLQGISFDTKGTRSCTIDIGAGGGRSSNINHVIDLPLKICQCQEDDGSVDLQIEPANGPMTLVHVSPPTGLSA